MFALDPVIDAEQFFVRQGPIDYQQDVPVDVIAVDLLKRAQIASEIGTSVAHNLRTAHERDCRRFKARRSGLYVPRIHHFNIGDYVFVIAQGLTPGGTLGIRAKNEVLRVLEVRDSGVLVLQNQAGRTIEKHFEHCVPCMLPNLIGDTYAGLVKPQADLPCQVCRDHHHWESMLLCDNCDTGWHIYCLDPPLDEVPEGQWLCPDCVACGVTLHSLAEKQARFVTDPESRPNLELPSRTRVARARQYSELWHGKAVSHTTRGRTRYGRMNVQGVLCPKWFRIDWSDGTSSEHNAGLLRHLAQVDEQFLPVAIPAVTDAVVLWTRHLAPVAPVAYDDVDQVATAIQQYMGGPDVSPESVVDTMVALNVAYVSNGSVSPLSDYYWEAFRRVLPLARLGTCFLPLAPDGSPVELTSRGVSCLSNHPAARSQASLHLDPFQHQTYCSLAEADMLDCCVLWPVSGLLDLLLPLAFSQVRHCVAALVPAVWFSDLQPHRDVWLHDEVWRPGLGLIVRIVRTNGSVDPRVWFLAFTSLDAREQVLGSRIPPFCTEVVWDVRRPYQLTYVSAWHSTLRVLSAPSFSAQSQR